MARLSALVEATAEATGWSSNNVSLYARYAREAGYIKQAARGMAAAEMGASDGAALLGAMMASHYAKDTKHTLDDLQETVRTFNGWDNAYFDSIKDFEMIMRPVPMLIMSDNLERVVTLPKCLDFLAAQHSILGLLTGLIERAADGSLARFISKGRGTYGTVGLNLVVQRSPLAANLELIAGSWSRGKNSIGQVVGKIDYHFPRADIWRGDLISLHKVSHYTILRMGKALA
ncbi:hypothetical protein [Caenispirillum bisanense]|uniref:hypothetical protein n=1 Tax=Caenispirillum bisanense TaxID=414052 RepID=UPI0031D8176A